MHFNFKIIAVFRQPECRMYFRDTSLNKYLIIRKLQMLPNFNYWKSSLIVDGKNYRHKSNMNTITTIKVLNISYSYLPVMTENAVWYAKSVMKSLSKYPYSPWKFWCPSFDLFPFKHSRASIAVLKVLYIYSA